MCGLWMAAKLGSGLADGKRQRTRRFLLSDASALKRARAAAAATEWNVDEVGTVLECGPGALGARVEAVALFVGLERVARVFDDLISRNPG